MQQPEISIHPLIGRLRFNALDQRMSFAISYRENGVSGQYEEKRYKIYAYFDKAIVNPKCPRNVTADKKFYFFAFLCYSSSK